MQPPTTVVNGRTYEVLYQEHHANAICSAFALGTTQLHLLAFRHACSEALVRDILAGRRYGHVTGRGEEDPTVAKTPVAV